MSTTAAPGTPGATAPSADDPVALHVRHNLVVLGLDFGLFLVGLSFASQSTILPAFAEYLGAPNVVIGAIPAVMTAGWMLPSLFASGHTASLRRRLPFVLRWTVWERVPFLVLALAAFFLADRAPATTLAVVLGMLLVITGTGGLLMPAWMDIVGRTVPVTLRGRFMALSSLLGNAGGLLGTTATTWVLAAVAAPASYGVCFLLATAAMTASFLALCLVREPEAAAPAAVEPLAAYLRRMPALLRQDDNLRRFLVVRAGWMAATAGAGFFTVHALRDHGAATWQVGTFTAALLAGQVAGNAVLGWMADRLGHRLSVAAGVAAMAVANAVALGAPSLAVHLVAFALAGVSVAASHVSSLNILLELAPEPGARPTYVGLGNTAMAPIALAGPLVAGLAADRVGLGWVFGTSTLAGAVALAYLLRVRDPRQAGAASASGPAAEEPAA